MKGNGSSIGISTQTNQLPCNLDFGARGMIGRAGERGYANIGGSRIQTFNGKVVESSAVV